MLILTRKPGESLFIGDVIKVTVVEIKGNQIRVGIDAPADLRIYREEIYVQILEENKKAAESAMVPESGLEGLSQAWQGRIGDVKKPKNLVGGGFSSARADVTTSKAVNPQVVIRKKRKNADE